MASTARAVSEDEITEFRSVLQGWLRPRMQAARDIRRSAIWSTRSNPEEEQFRRALARDLGERGWLFPMFPVEYGGGGLAFEHQLVVEEELHGYGIDLVRVFDTESCIVAPCILAWGTDEQKREFLPPMMRGEKDVWQVLTEPQGGSDAATCRTVALRDGDKYVVTGEKTMVGSTQYPDWLWTLVCTDPDGKRHENLSWLLIPADLPGINIQRLEMIMGIKNTIYFDKVNVPARLLVGGENNGWAVSTTHLELEHGGGGGIGSDRLVANVVQFCKETMVDGVPLSDDPHVREVLADMVIDSDVEGVLGRRTLEHRFRRDPHPYGGPQYRYYVRMRRLRNSERLQDLLGYVALEANLDVDEKLDFSYVVRSGPGMLHGGGTLDTDRLIIARRMGLGRRTVEAAPTTI